jgi:hypothetical protein
MKVGTLDSLMALSDELQKVDTFVENVVKKCEKTLTDLLDKDTSAGLYVENQRSTSLVYLTVVSQSLSVCVCVYVCVHLM